VFDTAQNAAILFGGSRASGGESDETWTWTGVVWERLSVLGPTPRYGAGMAYDESRGMTILFGGDSNLVRFSDTWLLGGGVWSEGGSAGPSARYGHRMVFDSARGEIVLFGGRPCPTSGDAVDGQTWIFREALRHCAADTNADGFLDFFDYDEFVAHFESGDHTADFNRDCFIDFFDYDEFVEAFETGC
jgi:hypothetical protein